MKRIVLIAVLLTTVCVSSGAAADRAEAKLCKAKELYMESVQDAKDKLQKDMEEFVQSAKKDEDGLELDKLELTEFKKNLLSSNFEMLWNVDNPGELAKLPKCLVVPVRSYLDSLGKAKPELVKAFETAAKYYKKRNTDRALEIEAEKELFTQTGLVTYIAVAENNEINELIGPHTTIKDNTLVVSNKEYLTSKSSYRPPVQIDVVAKTDSNDLRVEYAAGKIVFSWGGNKDQLFICDGLLGTKYIDGQGFVEPNKFVRVTLIVTNDTAIIAVDGKVRYTTKADFSAVNEPVKISTYFRSTVTVKYFSAQKYPPSSKKGRGSRSKHK